MPPDMARHVEDNCPNNGKHSSCQIKVRAQRRKGDPGKETQHQKESKDIPLMYKVHIYSILLDFVQLKFVQGF